jgi:hypothetical protein
MGRLSTLEPVRLMKLYFFTDLKATTVTHPSPIPGIVQTDASQLPPPRT